MLDFLPHSAFTRSVGPWTGHALRVGVAPGALALLRTSIWPHERTLLLGDVRFDAAGGPAAMGNALTQLLGEQRTRGWPLTLVLADELVRLWQVTPPHNGARLADLHGAAALRFQALFGASAAEWQIQADWSATRPFLAAALPRPLLGSLLAAARARRCRVVEIVPQFVAALNQSRSERRPGAWFGLVHGGVLSIAAFEGKLLAAVRTAPIPPGADRDWLEGHVAREALRVGLGRPERLQIRGPAPKSWASSAGRLKFACTLLDDKLEPLWPDVARLALSGSRV
jgi:hypothetical protein